MACNCKQRNEVIEEYGMPEEEGLLSVLYRNLMKVVFFVMALIIGILLVPIILVVMIYQMTFVKEPERMIILPKVLSKHIK